MLNISFEQLQELIIQNQKLVEQAELSRQLYHTTYSSSIQTEICQGSAASTIIREGITLLMIQLTFKQDTRVELKSLQPQIGFAYAMKGSTYIFRQNMKVNENSVTHLEFSFRTGYIYATASSEGWQQFSANRPFRAIYIHFSDKAFKQLLGEHLQDLPAELINAIDDENGFYLRTTKISSSIMALCESLLENPFSGKSRQFYLEAKVIELIAYQLDELAKPETAGETGLRLTPKEETQLEYCYQTLLASLENPPSLIELAREIGMSDYRLKNGFKQKYGLTPYRFVSEKRMYKAKELLKEGKLNVSEVAAAVGFTSLGSFSNSFYEKFRIRPSEVK